MGLVSLTASLTAVACDEKHEGSAPPPPAPSARPSVCKDGGGTATEDETVFQRVVAGYCIDPHGQARAYGSGAKAPLEEVCMRLLGGDCDAVESSGLERVTTLRYVADAGVGSVDVALLRFGRRAQSFAFFTRRVLGDADPIATTAKSLDAPAQGAVKDGVVYAWRGNHVLELSYVSELESPEQRAASSVRILPELARALGERLVGPKEPLEEVQLLPTQNRLPLGVSYEGDKLLGVAATGPGAIGHYRDGDKRYQVLASLRDDEQAALDLRETLGRAGFSRPIKKKHAIEVRFPATSDTPAQRWVFAQRGNALIGVGDERFDKAPATDEPERALESKMKTLEKIIADNKLPPPKRKKGSLDE